MITLIETQEELNNRLESLIDCYKIMFSEEPFNNNSITDEYARDFFINTFENGLIFIDTPSNFGKIYGFRTMIKSNCFKDHKRFNMIEGSYYLSALWIDKELRGRGLGYELMKHSLKVVKKLYNTKKVYVRTRTDTPHIINVLKRSRFDVIDEYSTEINNVSVGLIVWSKDI